jgi:hypothetical protein
MASLTIGDKKVTVDDSFFSLSPADQQRTVDEIAAQIGFKPAAQVAPPKPGSREYADWAAQQARAGNALPQVGPTPPEWKDPLSSDMGAKAQAIGSAWLNDIPIAGPSILDLAQKGKAALYGVPLETVQRDTQRAMDANPIEAKTAGVLSSVASLAPLAATNIGGKLLGATGSLPWQMFFGAGSGGVIAAADTAARGGNTEDVTKSGLIGAGAGGALPLVARGAGALWNAATGRGVSAEAKQLGQALKDDEISPAAIPQMLKEMGPDAMAVDLGPNMQQLGGGLASTPGTAQKTLREAVAARSKGDTARVANDVAQTVGNAPDIDTLTADIIATRKAASDPLYKQVRPQPLKPTPNLKFVFETPMGKEALAETIKIARNDGFDPSAGLTVGVIDYMKQALDDIAREAGKAGKNNRARQASDLATLLRNEADAQVPQYAAAREAFAGPSQIKDAIETGQTLLNKDVSPMQLQGMLKDMSEGERDALLQGFQAQVGNMLGNSGNNVRTIRDMLRKPYNESKLRILLGDDVTDDLLKRVDRQLTFGETDNVVARNSESARRLAAQARVNPDVKALNTGGDTTVIGLFVQAINAARNGIRGKMQPKTNARMASFLASGAGDIDPAMLDPIARGMKPQTPLLLTPASSGLLANEMMGGNRRPVLDITVGGGR